MAQISHSKPCLYLTGNDLPYPIHSGTIVPYEETFLLVGGSNRYNNISDRVHRYTPDGHWEDMTNLRLSEARYDAAAMLVSSTIFQTNGLEIA